MPKHRISMTVKDELASEVDVLFRKLVREALDKNKELPKLSNFYEQLVELGLESYKKKQK